MDFSSPKAKKKKKKRNYPENILLIFLKKFSPHFGMNAD